MSVKQKYYMVVDDKRIIWGVGKTPTRAKKDALESIANVFSQDSIDPKKLNKHPIPCSKRLYEQVSVDGATKQDTWTMIGDIAELDEHINTLENISEMRSLIDGAYDVIYAYTPTDPSSIKWREGWLEKARKHGASLDW